MTRCLHVKLRNTFLWLCMQLSCMVTIWWRIGPGLYQIHISKTLFYISVSKKLLVYCRRLHSSLIHLVISTKTKSLITIAHALALLSVENNFISPTVMIKWYRIPLKSILLRWKLRILHNIPPLLSPADGNTIGYRTADTIPTTTKTVAMYNILVLPRWNDNEFN